MKPYSFHIRKINEAKRGLNKSITEGNKREIRRWARLLESNTKLLVNFITEQIEDEGKLEQSSLFATTVPGGAKGKKGSTEQGGGEK